LPSYREANPPRMKPLQHSRCFTIC
jgi:hypothetical protein